jgi:RluA family pseudouridine synthase
LNDPSIPADTQSTTPGGALSVVNLAAYHFAPLANLPQRQARLRQICHDLSLKGSILLSPEGINLFVAGSREAVDQLLQFLRSDEALARLEGKESYSNHQPFQRMLVKVKKEIIAFGVEEIVPHRKTSRKILPRELHEWLTSEKDVVLLDVRNNFEVAVGTFDDAVPIDVDSFRDFPSAVERLPEEFRQRPIVMFCTGGIRCEKAGPYLERAGFQDVYQLSGGILKYFEEVGGDFYRGECFVFDKRVALDPQLKETATTQCYACQSPLSVNDQQSPHYSPPHSCPHCYLSSEQKQTQLLLRRQARIREVISPLPGSIPYDNPRPLNVQARFDGLTLLDFVKRYHPHFGDQFWEEVCSAGRIHQNGKPVPADRIVRAGEQFAHLHPATIEPDVAADIQILHEDDAIVAVSKPAPLPTHPSGRFNRNSLQWILNQVYAPWKLRPAHRLDANTTGLVLFCKTRASTALVQPQFEKGLVEKTYLVRVQGAVPWTQHTCEAPISRTPAACGGRTVCEDGLPSKTHFTRIRIDEDGTTLMQAVPATGRTNQIRVHLWHLGFPVCGDPLYLREGAMGAGQTQAAGDIMCLHAAALTFDHPQSEKRVTYRAPEPSWV